MMQKYFIIKDFPSDVYRAVGQIIKSSQELEEIFKKLAKLLNISIKNLNTSSLNRINKKLKEQNLILQEDYDNLSKVINVRNYINHDFFLNDFIKKYDSYEEKLSTLECILNFSQFVIFEADDVINNKIDVLKGGTIMRPTFFD